MIVTASETQEIFWQLIEKRLSREEVVEWAFIRTQAYDNEELEFVPPDDEGRIWETLQYLEGVDLKDSPETYLHVKEDFIQEFRDKWGIQSESERLSSPPGERKVYTTTFLSSN